MTPATKGEEISDDDVLRAIQNFTATNGFPPTTREIGNLVGLKSPSSVHQRLELLRRAGKVTWIEKSPRTIRVIEEPPGG